MQLLNFAKPKDSRLYVHSNIYLRENLSDGQVGIQNSSNASLCRHKSETNQEIPCTKETDPNQSLLTERYKSSPCFVGVNFGIAPKGLLGLN
jgi:hypothetical protein